MNFFYVLPNQFYCIQICSLPLSAWTMVEPQQSGLYCSPVVMDMGLHGVNHIIVFIFSCNLIILPVLKFVLNLYKYIEVKNLEHYLFTDIYLAKWISMPWINQEEHIHFHLAQNGPHGSSGGSLGRWAGGSRGGPGIGSSSPSGFGNIHFDGYLGKDWGHKQGKMQQKQRKMNPGKRRKLFWADQPMTG